MIQFVKIAGEDTPISQWDAIKNSFASSIQGMFPISGRKNILEVGNITYDESAATAGDIKAQELAKHQEKTWGIPVYAEFILRDKVTGEVLNRSKQKIAVMPKQTQRFTYLIGGSEWNSAYQWRLKSGIYSKIKENGEHVTEFNLQKQFAREARMQIPFDSESKKFKFHYATNNLPLYSILKCLDVPDEAMKKEWSEDIYKANISKNWQADITKFYKNKLSKRGVKAVDENNFDSIKEAVKNAFHEAEVNPETTKITMGKAHNRITGDTMLAASTHILKVSKGDQKPDEIYAPYFKHLLGLDDFISEKFGSSKTAIAIKSKIKSTLDRRDRISQILPNDLFSKPLRQVFIGNSLSQRPEQTNPLDILSSHNMTTIMGPGGISSEHSIRNSMKVLNQGQLGFLDPIHSPESSQTGISLHLPIGVIKHGKEARLHVYDLKERKFTFVNPSQLHGEITALPDQFKFIKGVPHAVEEKITVLDPKTHEFRTDNIRNVKYIIPSAKHLFDEASNMIPFLQNNQGNRTMTGAKLPTQGVSLLHREAPLVQVQSPVATKSFEELFGKSFSHQSPIDGEVVAIKKDHLGYADEIHIKDKSGKVGSVQLYNHFPLNDKKSFIHAEPIVKVGDKVKTGQVIADSNHTFNGQLAIGTNLKVGYFNYKNLTFEDGVVISESGAKKLTSEHLHKMHIDLEPKTDAVDLKKYLVHIGSIGKKVHKDKLVNLDEQGLVKPGSIVKPGEVLVAAVSRNTADSQLSMFGTKLKGAITPYKDKSLVWENDYEGEVVKTIKRPGDKGYTIYIKTKEPMTVGDKLCVTADHAVLTREGWKFVDKITLEDEILTLNPTTQKTEYQQPVELHFYPEGGDMYKVESSEVDLFVTTDHKMYASENDGFFKIIPAKNVYGKRVRYKSLEGVTKKIAPNEESLIKNCKEPVYCFEVPNHIFYIKRNGKAVWTSNCGRHGNKSIVGTILPDNLMPRGEDGKPLDLIHNSSGIASRINVGQILETAASKIARKTGKPYVVDNFSPEKYNYSEKIRQDLKKHGLKDTERVYDPSLGKYLQEEPLVGEQFFIKQRHQVEKKLSVRGMDNQKYTINLSPRGGGDVGAQAIGQLEFYALLAHGARHNLKEIATYKADKQVDDKLQDTDFWLKVQLGIPLPPPKPTFAYKKFEAMLTGLGINLHKAGNDVILQPLTDKGVLKMGTGEISNAHQVRGKDDKEMVGGLFDPKLTGGVPNGVGKGQLWSYIKLAEPMPNPVFTGSKQLPGPAAVLTGLKWDEFNAIVKGTKHIDINGKSLTGGHAVNELLKKVNVEKELEATLKKLPHLKDAELNKENRKAKYLQALSKLKMRPEEAYMMNYVPVLPPIFRPIVPMEDGTIRHSDITELYKKLILVNNKLKDKEVNKYMPEVEQKLREETFDILKASLGVGTMPTYDGNRKLKGLLQTIAGDSPKMGFFQDKIMKRRQELSMRSTIIPAQDMGIDEVGIPKDAAMELYKPFVIRELVYRGKDLLEAKKEIKEKTPIALKALDRVITERPVLLKRDPVLHKYNVQAFMPKLIEGSAIQLHGLNCGAFNSDFDGDTMAAYLPLTEEARREALEKMLPSKNLFSSTHYGILHAPEQEAVIGLHLLTNWGTKKNKVYDSKAKILADKELKPSDVVSFVEKGKPKETTKGRLLLASHLPEAFQTPELLYSPSYSLKKKSIHEILENIAKSSPHEYPTMVNKLRNLGSNTAHEMGFTFSMKDLTPLTGLRDSILKPYGDEEARIRKQHNLSEEEQDAKIVALYTDATKKLDTDIHKAYADKNDNNIFKMVKTKARGSDASLRQMLIAPMLLVDTNGKVIPTPVTRSYSEGLTISDYWTTLHGARKGVIDRAQGTARPGALAKELVNLSITTLINKDDCGTTKGHRVPVIDKLGGEEIDITDRLLAKDHPELGLKKDQLVTPEVYSKLKEAGHKYVEVRSALNCALPHGVCSKCMGLSQDGRLHEIGTNIGVIASQALSEPATQLSMDTIGKKSMVTVLINNEIQTISVEHLWDLV